MIEDGTYICVERKTDSAAFRPAGVTNADLEAFQAIVRDLRAHGGDGYGIHLEHPVSDHGNGMIDLVLVTLASA